MFAVIGAISALLGIAGTVALIFDFDIQYDATDRFQQQYDRSVAKLVEEGISSAQQAASKGQGGLEAFKSYMSANVKEQNKGDAVVAAAEILDDLVACHRALGCNIKDFSRYRKPIQDFWYAYRGYLIPLRGNGRRSNLASEVQKEAEQSYREDRERGLVK